MAKTIVEMTAEVREVNIEKGWRSGDSNTLGDYIALLHSEVAEAVEAFRDYRLGDATDSEIGSVDRTGRVVPKPVGVGSEFADILIRLLDTCDVFGLAAYDPDAELADVADIDPRVSEPDLPELRTFGDHMAWLHRCIDQMWTGDRVIAPAWALRALVTVARKYGISLGAEFERKIAYNRTRPYQHGGRTLSDAGGRSE